jgi:hypothetical protein
MMEAWSKLRGERRSELKVSPDEPLIGYISSFINKEKGLEHFVKMAVLVSEQYPKAKYLVIGTPGDKNYYDRCVRKVKLEGLTSRFKFAGYEECLPSAYCAMDLLVVPSLIREGFGMTALEGMAFGKPVVAYDSGGLQEILHMAGCGNQLAPVEDIEALADRVKVLLAEPGLAAAIGSQSRERVDAVYGPAAYRARLLGLAERWQLRYCTAAVVELPICSEPAEPLSGGAPVQLPVSEAPGSSEPVVAAAEPPPPPPPPPEQPEQSPPGKGHSRRATRLRRARLRRGKLRRAKARARRSGRPGRKRRTARPARRKGSGGKSRRTGSRARRRGKSRRKAA